MNKDLKSILISFSIVLLYFYATIGIVNIFGKNESEHLNNVRVNLVFTLLAVGTLFMIIVPYHLFGPGSVETLYKSIILFHLAYLIVGCFTYPKKEK
jgi:hypothetical protein